MRILGTFLSRLVLVLLLALPFATLPLFSQQVSEQQQMSPQQINLLNSIEQKLLETQKQLAICQQLLKDRSLTSPDYQAKTQQLEATIADLTQQISDLKQIRDSLQASSDTSQTIIISLSSRIASLESQLTQLKAQLAAQSQTFELYKATNDKTVKDLELQSGGYKTAAIVFGFATFTGGGYIISGDKWQGAAIGAASAGAVWAAGHFLFHLW